MTTEMVGNVSVTPFDGEQDSERKRKLALLKAVGLDRVPVEQRELALAIAKRYDLDLLLKHLVLIDGKPYITRDALLWIAHRSGQFDGITVTRPLVEGDYWYAEATVYRKDMSHPFVYGGRYPVKGKNANFGPEMAVKVAECMSLRRAFNVSAPSVEERWDVDIPAAEPEPPKSLAEKAAERAQAIMSDALSVAEQAVDAETGEIVEVTEPAPKEPTKATGTTTPTPPTTDETVAEAVTAASKATTQCASISKLSNERCRREQGHGNLHRTENEAWTDADAVK